MIKPLFGLALTVIFVSCQNQLYVIGSGNAPVEDARVRSVLSSGDVREYTTNEDGRTAYRKADGGGFIVIEAEGYDERIMTQDDVDETEGRVRIHRSQGL